MNQLALYNNSGSNSSLLSEAAANTSKSSGQRKQLSTLSQIPTFFVSIASVFVVFLLVFYIQNFPLI